LASTSFGTVQEHTLSEDDGTRDNEKRRNLIISHADVPNISSARQEAQPALHKDD
jgi:hypothetical protein